MSKPRDFYTVAQQLLTIIDRHLDQAPMVKAKATIEKGCRDAAYTPPECMNGYWGLLGQVVTEVVGDPPLTKDWHFELVSTLMNISIEKAKELYAAK